MSNVDKSLVISQNKEKEQRRLLEGFWAWIYGWAAFLSNFYSPITQDRCVFACLAEQL